MSTAISIRGLSKKYILRHQTQERYTALRDVLANGVKRAGRRLLDHIRGNNPADFKATREEFWALKDVDLEIKHGDRVGIIGRNGAGKSTLLKIISRVVEPTAGRVTVRGRMASLLEVGTGFHPELTGRENIFLNASILGMSRRETRAKFDDIAGFADVERFLDTPVKRYSSGMYVRLAFSVAAHLEPDILVVDEVLAVGDAAFQRKCLGKIDEACNQGRTVLFVSHNMATVTSLCRNAILLVDGKVRQYGPTSEVVMSYYTNGSSTPALVDFSGDGKAVGDVNSRLLTAAVRNGNGDPVVEASITEPIVIEMEFEIFNSGDLTFEPNFHFFTADGVHAFATYDTSRTVREKGVYIARCEVPGNFLNEGSYFVGLALTSYKKGVNVHFYEKSALSFNVRDPIENVPTRSDWVGAFPGVVRPLLTWRTERTHTSVGR